MQYMWLCDELFSYIQPYSMRLGDFLYNYSKHSLLMHGIGMEKLHEIDIPI